MTRTPDIFLTPHELDERAEALAVDAHNMSPGPAKDRAIKDALQDRRMADLKRMVGDPNDRLAR